MNDTIKQYVSREIVVESKMNNLSLWQIDYLYPSVQDTPILPKGMVWRPQREYYESTREINGVKMYAGYGHDFLTALKALESFCEKHKIKM